MFVVGIDENGLGPKLGFFCVTAALFESDEYEAENFWKMGKGFVADSKEIVSFKNVSRGLDVVRFYTKFFRGFQPQTASALLNAVSFRKPADIKSSCPAHCADMCWGGDWFFPEPEEKNFPASGVASSGANLKGVYTFYVCPREFNAMCRDASKFSVEFSIMERLFKFFYENFGKDVLYLCGKLGGTARYERFFDFLEKFSVLGKREGEDSVYVLENFGRIEFLKKAEKKHFPVALASVYGKVVREIFIRRLNRFLGGGKNGIPYASGYNDVVTKKFIEKTKAARKRLKIPDECFFRIK